MNPSLLAALDKSSIDTSVLREVLADYETKLLTEAEHLENDPERLSEYFALNDEFFVIHAFLSLIPEKFSPTSDEEE